MKSVLNKGFQLFSTKHFNTKMNLLRDIVAVAILQSSAANLIQWCEEIDSTADSTKYHMNVPVVKVRKPIDVSSFDL